MGVRANLVLRSGGQNLVFFDKWRGEHLASRVLYEAFFGPFDFPEGLVQPFGRSEEALMNDVWCEGALLLDRDERRCVFFGGDGKEYAHYHRPALRHDVVHLCRMRLRSSGTGAWSLAWAEEEVASVADVAGIDRRTVASAREIPVVKLRPARDDGAQLVALTRIAGETRVARVAQASMDFRPLLTAGLCALARGPTYVLESFPQLPEATPALLGRASAGAIIDENERCLRIWQSRPLDLDFIRAGWPGWHVTVSTNALAEQRGVADGALLTDPAELLAYLGSAVSPSGPERIRDRLLASTCPCGHVVGYGDEMPFTSDDDPAPTTELIARLARGLAPWSGIIDRGDYLPAAHECQIAELDIKAAFDRARAEHETRSIDR